MATAPFCNVKLVQEPANPTASKGIAHIPTNATLQQAITIINNNFNKLLSVNFVEDRSQRVTVPITVTDPKTGVSFTFDQINQMVLRDPKTGSVWTWTRN